jgi:hypothetical protein
MIVSSRRGQCGRFGCPGPVIPEKRPENIDTTAGQGDDGLAVGSALAALLQVVVAVGALTHHAGLRRQIEYVPKNAAVASRTVQIPGPTSGVVGNRNEPRRSPSATPMAVSLAAGLLDVFDPFGHRGELGSGQPGQGAAPALP